MATITLEGKEYQLDIEKAKKLNLLKEKKDSRVKSWYEFKNKYVNKTGYVYSDNSNIAKPSTVPLYTSDQLTPHEAKAITAFSKLLKLRRDWIGEWEPEDKVNAYAIVYWKSILVDWIDCSEEYRSLSFPTKQMAQEFLETFRDLIEEAKILI